MSLSSRDIRLLTERGAQDLHWLHNIEQTTAEHSPPQGLAHRSLRGTAVRQLMSSKISCVKASASLHEAARMMQAGDGAFTVVVDEQVPVGIVTERDMIRILADILAAPDSASASIAEFMSKPPVYLREDASLYQAMKVFESRRVGQIPIVDSANHLVGVLSRDSLSRAQLNALEEERNAIERQVHSHSRALNKVNRQLKALALQDSLLKIGNRRALEVDVQSTHMNAVRHGHTYALALIDVDYFKRYNDHYGHCAGDRALITIANCLKDSIRRGDRVYRYGGEELLLMMPETSLHEAVEAVWRLADKLYQLNVDHERSPHGRLTISAGVSALVQTNGAKATWQMVLEEADACLYQAKAMGRNKVCGFPEECPAPHRHHS